MSTKAELADQIATLETHNRALGEAFGQGEGTVLKQAKTIQHLREQIRASARCCQEAEDMITEERANALKWAEEHKTLLGAVEAEAEKLLAGRDALRGAISCAGVIRGLDSTEMGLLQDEELAAAFMNGVEALRSDLQLAPAHNLRDVAESTREFVRVFRGQQGAILRVGDELASRDDLLRDSLAADRAARVVIGVVAFLALVVSFFAAVHK